MTSCVYYSKWYIIGPLTRWVNVTVLCINKSDIFLTGVYIYIYICVRGCVLKIVSLQLVPASLHLTHN